jgi:hypothetical protein
MFTRGMVGRGFSLKAEFDEFVGLELANKKLFDLFKRSDFGVCDDTAKKAVAKIRVSP